MTDRTLERTEMIKRALEYFGLRSNELVEPEDEANHVNSLLLEDIRSNTQIKYRSQACDALVTYVAGLENSKKIACEKLPAAKLSFDHINREIELADKLKKELCK